MALARDVVLASERLPCSAPPLLDAAAGEDPANGLPSERRWPTPPIFAALGRLPAEAADPVVPPPTAALPPKPTMLPPPSLPAFFVTTLFVGCLREGDYPPPSSIRHPGRR
jgi:hypothetical protein